MLCRSCRQAFRAYSQLKQPTWAQSSSKWARPMDMPIPQRPVKQDIKRPKVERSREEVRRDYEARKSARIKAIAKPSPIQSTPVAPKVARKQPVSRSKVFLPTSISISNLSRKLNLRLEQLQDKLHEAGFENAHDHLLSSEDATLIANEYDYDVIVDDTTYFDLYPSPKTNTGSSRSPLVTIMGHVDHGKTTLLDNLRKASVAASEAGGITQHIGAFSVTLPSGKQITFLDTPGHAAFEAMRARGAKVTDIVVLVVAADDSIMPQTKEAIKHAQAAGVNMIVAINKMDKPGVNPERVKRDLMACGVEVEDFGGEVQCVPVSALRGTGLDDLENAIISLSEIMDLRAPIDGPVEGTIIESSVKKGRGNVSTMIVSRGTLKTGSILIAGQSLCKVRSMTSDTGKPIKQAGPSTPVEVSGWSTLPSSGESVLQPTNEKQAKSVIENRSRRAEQVLDLNRLSDLNDSRAGRQVTEEGRIILPIIIKADVDGSIGALLNSLSVLGNSEIGVKVVDASVGAVNDSDIARAVTGNCRIITFNTPIDASAMKSIIRDNVKVISSPVIYELIESLKAELSSLLPPIQTIRVLGEAEVVQLFSINGLETPISGCRITNGKIEKSGQFKVTRGEEIIYDAHAESLRHRKSEVTSLGKGMECGLHLPSSLIQPGDKISCYRIESTPRQL